MANVALMSVGSKLQEKSASQTSPVIKVRIEAAPDLNAGDDDRGLASVVRLYELRAEHIFMATPYSSFGKPEKEKQDMGDHLVQVRELLLSPGQVLEHQDKLSEDASYLRVTALVRAPRAQRWQYPFAAPEADRAGVVLGVHACAISATSAPPIRFPAGDAALLSSASCQRSFSPTDQSQES